MEKWSQVALVAVSGVNLTLLCYILWNVRNARRGEMELKLTRIQQSVNKISEDVAVLKLELTPLPRVQRRDRHRHALVNDRESEFQSATETKDGESDFFDFSDFSDEESNTKRVGEVLQEVDGRDLECQTDSDVCDGMLKLLVDLCPIRGHNQPLDTSSIPSCEVAWRISRCYIHSVAHMKQSGVNVAHISDTIRTAIAYSEAGFRLDNDSWLSHKWYAICCGSLSQSESTQEKARLGVEFKTHLEVAIELAPNEATLYHLMGNWYFELSHFSWVMKKAATTLYGDIFSGSVEQAEQMFLKAENLNAGFWIRNQVFLAKCCLKRGDKSGAENWTRLALSAKVSTPDDHLARTEAENLAKENFWENPSVFASEGLL